MSTPDNIRRLTPAQIREVWPSEPNDFTPWLAKNLAELDILGIGSLSLVTIESEVPGTWRSLDILAETENGDLVAIENQYKRLDHDHLTRALAYAVGLDAKAAVVIAEEHLPEFRAVARYLNTCAEQLGEDGGIPVFLVMVAVSRVEEYFVPTFTVVEQPNSWLTETAAERPPHLASVEEFLGRCPPKAQPATRQILSDWEELDFNQGAHVSHKAQSVVGLYRGNPLKPNRGDTCVFLLDLLGQLTINRGYLIEGGLGQTDEDVATLDSTLDKFFPGYRRTPKNYYPVVERPDPEAVRGFSAWLAERFDELAGQLGKK